MLSLIKARHRCLTGEESGSSGGGEAASLDDRTDAGDVEQSGSSGDEEACFKCGGTGKVTCPKCDGDRYICA